MVKDGNGDDDEEGVMGVLPPPVARRVERLKCLNSGRDRVMGKYLEERAALEKKNIWINASLYTRKEETSSPDV